MMPIKREPHETPTQMTAFTPHELLQAGPSRLSEASSQTITPIRDSFISPGRSREMGPQVSLFDRLQAESSVTASPRSLLDRIQHLGNGYDGIFASSPFGPSAARAGEQYLTEHRCHRALQVENVHGVPQVFVVDIFRRSQFPTVRGPSNVEHGPGGKFCVAFTDSRDATWARQLIPRLEPGWRLVPITARQYAQKVNAENASNVSNHEGQVRVHVFKDARGSVLTPADMEECVRGLLELVGEIQSMKSAPGNYPQVLVFEIEFFDIQAAENATRCLHCATFEGGVLEVVAYRPDVESQDPRISSAGMVSRTSDPYRRSSSFRALRSSCLYPSPGGFLTHPESDDDDTDSMTIVAGNGSPLPRHRSSRAACNQLVDTERIRLGLDVRTTVMLRNIPNRMTQVKLKSIIDETSRAKYDFMYLRFDFEKRCNVGYAFINFADPLDIIDFVHARAGRKWDSFSSEKVAEIRYATIQGKDRLISKFRNSGVMLSQVEYRPKIYTTGKGALAGREIEFPAPDDMAKLNRSVANTTSNGLYGPRSALRRAQLPRDVINSAPTSAIAAAMQRPRAPPPAWELPLRGRT